jgi:hypothetical protein
MATAVINSPVSVKSATRSPLPARAAAICAETEATNTQNSSGRLLLRLAAIAVRLRATRSGSGRSESARPGRRLQEDARYADAPLPDDRTVRRRCAWFCRISVPSLEPLPLAGYRANQANTNMLRRRPCILTIKARQMGSELRCASLRLYRMLCLYERPARATVVLPRLTGSGLPRTFLPHGREEGRATVLGTCRRAARPRPRSLGPIPRSGR